MTTDTTLKTTQNTALGYSNIGTVGVISASSSKSLYYLYSISAPDGSMVRKVKDDGSQAWVVLISVTPISKSLTVNLLEDKVFFASSQNPVTVFVLNALNGVLFKNSIYINLNGYNEDLKIHPLSDNTGYYIISSSQTTNPLSIYKCLFSNLANPLAQKITYLVGYGFGQFMLSDSELFFLGLDSFTHLHFLKMTFGNNNIDWGRKLLCSSAT